MTARRGSILILVLFVLTVLSLAAVSLSYRAGLERRTVRNTAIIARLEAHAASAVAIALSRLEENTNDFDHRAEPWHDHRALGGEDWIPEWEEDDDHQAPAFVTDYQVIDEEGKLMVLLASSTALEELGMTRQQIASLFDWMDEDLMARAEGAENDFYLSRRTPHHSKNAPIEVLEELLMVRGFRVADFYGEDADRDRQLDPHENDGGLSFPPDDADGRLRLGWVDLLTCRGDGRININTAPRSVLELLPLSDGAAEQIAAFRAFDELSSGNLEDHVFNSSEVIDELQGLTKADRAVLNDAVIFKSTHFRIFAQSVHLLTGLRHHVEVLVRMGDDGAETLQWKTGFQE